MSQEEYQYLFKFVLIGDSQAGKSSFFSQYIQGHFNPEYEQTIAVEFESKVVELNGGVLIQNQVWDTAGGEHYRAISKTFLQNSAAAVLFYNITDRKSFDSIEQWYNKLKEVASPAIQLVLLGTHKDLEEMRQVSEQEGKAMAQELGSKFYEISVINDKDAIDGIVNSMSYEILRLINSNKINPNQSVYGIKLSQQFEQEAARIQAQLQEKVMQNRMQSPKSESGIRSKQATPVSSRTESQSQQQQQVEQSQNSEDNYTNQQNEPTNTTTQNATLSIWVYLIPILIGLVMYQIIV